MPSIDLGRVGGIGKPRLALQVAAANRTRFADGVYFVQLQSAQSVAALLFAIADTLHIALSGQQAPFQQLCEYLHTKSLLLVLDNFEHLLVDSDVALVGDLLAAAPNLKILVTSRAVLHLREEWLFAVQGLPFPPPGELDPAVECAAVALFVNCARQARTDFAATEDPAALARICQLVEGMPLALELAAAWVKISPRGHCGRDSVYAVGARFVYRHWPPVVAEWPAHARHRIVGAGRPTSGQRWGRQ